MVTFISIGWLFLENPERRLALQATAGIFSLTFEKINFDIQQINANHYVVVVWIFSALEPLKF